MKCQDRFTHLSVITRPAPEDHWPAWRSPTRDWAPSRLGLTDRHDHRRRTPCRFPATPLGRLSYARPTRRASRTARAAATTAGELTFRRARHPPRRLAQAFRRAGAGPGEVDRTALAELLRVGRGRAHAAALGGLLRVGLLPRLHTAEPTSLPTASPLSSWWTASGSPSTDGADPTASRRSSSSARRTYPPGACCSRCSVAAGTDDELPLPRPMTRGCCTRRPDGHPAGVRTTYAKHRGADPQRPRRFRDALVTPRCYGLVSHFSGDRGRPHRGRRLNVLHRAFEPARVADPPSRGDHRALLVPTMITMLLEELDRRARRPAGSYRRRPLPYAGFRDPALTWLSGHRAQSGEACSRSTARKEAMLPDHHPATGGPRSDLVNERGLPRSASAGRVTRRRRTGDRHEQRYSAAARLGRGDPDPGE
ncbi:hypothetical protein HBB16_16390 [Pseudonocardia sp. MCCB 268]|nr:hypothetical protein [Pseudonocardia cytotoxica]